MIDYQAPNSDSGFADAFFTAASQNTAGTVSTSWGESETFLAASILAGQEAATYVAAFDEAFLELAVQGQSAFDASGDAGAYDDSDRPRHHQPVGRHQLGQPVHHRGGRHHAALDRQLTGPDGSATVTVPAQRTWGWDYLWQADRHDHRRHR